MGLNPSLKLRALIESYFDLNPARFMKALHYTIDPLPPQIAEKRGFAAIHFWAGLKQHAPPAQTMERRPAYVIGKILLIQGKSLAISMQVVFPEQPAPRKRGEPLPQRFADLNGR